MAKSLITDAPSIVTADGVSMKVGQTVYGVDADCRGDRIPTVEALLVVQVDLGVRRSVRLRRSRGTEWTWSAEERRGACNTTDHYLYGDFHAARQAALDAAATHNAEANKKVDSARKAIETARKDAAKSVQRARVEYRKTQDALKDRNARIRKLRGMRKPSRA